MQLAVRDRLSLPLHPRHQPCAYIARTSGRECRADKDAHGEHANKCCKSLVVARHHALRDALRQIMQDAGCFAVCEQQVHLQAVPSSTQGSNGPADEAEA